MLNSTLHDEMLTVSRIESLPGCKLLAPILSQLAALYPSTKFVSIVSDHCIEDYPDKNCPTLLVYRAGKFTGQVVGTGGIGGDNITLGGASRRFSIRCDWDKELTKSNSNSCREDLIRFQSTGSASQSWRKDERAVFVKELEPATEGGERK